MIELKLIRERKFAERLHLRTTMDVLQSFLPLTLYGIALSSLERERLFIDRPQTWEGILDFINNELTIAKLEDIAWCREHWERLDRWTKIYDLKWTFPG